MLIYGIFRYGILDMNHNVYYVFVCFHLLNCHYTLAIALVTAVSKQQLQWCLGGGWPVSLQLGPPFPLAYDSLDVTCCPSQPWNSLGFKFPYIYIYHGCWLNIYQIYLQFANHGAPKTTLFLAILPGRVWQICWDLQIAQGRTSATSSQRCIASEMRTNCATDTIKPEKKCEYSIIYLYTFYVYISTYRYIMIHIDYRYIYSNSM